MTTENSPSFLARIKEALPDLHPAERRLGQFLFDFPGELASYDAQELAKLASVSKATVSRFVRRLGFDSYEHARKAVREEGQTGSRLFLGHAEYGSAGHVLDLSMTEERENLDWTFRRLDPRQLDELAAAIVASRKTWIAGFRISHSFATYLYWQLMKVVDDVAVIPGAGETLGEHVSRIRSDDCVVFIALRRRTRGLPALLDEIRATGARLALITDESMPPRTDIDWHFICQTKTSSPQFNHAAVLALCHQIVVRSTIQSGPEGRERLRQIEELNERLGLL